MGEEFADDGVIGRLLTESGVWAFVGLSGDPGREVYDQARLLQRRGKRIIPVHPDAETVLGEKGHRSLAEWRRAAPGTSLDVVGVYRRPEFAGGVVDEAIEAGAKAVWLPLGVVDEAAAGRAREAGLDVVMDRCPAIEWARRR